MKQGFFFFYLKGSFSILRYKGANEVVDIKKRLTVVYVALYEMPRASFLLHPSLVQQRNKKKRFHSTAFSAVNSAAIVFTGRRLPFFIHWLHPIDDNTRVHGYLSRAALFP